MRKFNWLLFDNLGDSKNMNFRFIEVGFHLVCIGIIIASITTFMSDFHDNKSTSLVDFKRFHETEIDRYFIV